MPATHPADLQEKPDQTDLSDLPRYSLILLFPDSNLTSHHLLQILSMRLIDVK